jgi:TonB family protein
VLRRGRGTRQEWDAMTLTIKESSPLENSTKPGSTAGSNPNQNTRSNPVCLEVVVTIRSLPGEKGDASAGSAKPTREEARTVIVFDNGAVLRLVGTFPAGQAVILSNPQGRDVVCRVVSARNLPTVKGYIEVEFLEPTVDFWGIHKPEAQTNISIPPPAVVTQPKAVTQPQIVPSEPPVPPPPPARVEPTVPVTAAPSGRAPSFEDIAGLVLMSPPPVERVRPPESTLRTPDFRNPDESTRSAVEAARTYSPPSTPGPSAELTSLSGTWDGGTTRKPSTSGDVLGKFSVAQTASESASSESRGKTPLIVAGAAVILIGLGTGLFFLRRAGSVTPSAVPVAAASQPTNPEPPTPRKGKTPAAVDQPVVEQTTQAPSSSPAVSAASSVPKDIVDASATSASQSTRHQANNVTATQPDHVDAKEPDRSTPRPQLARDLKMSAPKVESRSGRLVDGSVPNIDDAAVTSGVNGAPGGGLISTVSHLNLPAPPGAFGGPSSPGKTINEPRLISSTRPMYPVLAKQASVEGDVVVSAEIDATGKVIGAKATTGPMYLRQAAVDAVRNWKYDPATINGTPTSAQISIKIQFRLGAK